MNPLLNALKIEIREFCSDHLALRQIDQIFSNAGFKKDESTSYSSNTRRSLVEEYYEALNWEQIDTIYKFIKVIETILQLHLLTNEVKDRLRSACRNCGFEVESEGSKVFYEGIPSATDLFMYQFPAGLPFGRVKPGFAVKAEKGSQTLKFEWQHGIGIIKNSVYPKFDYQKLANAFGCDTTNVTLKQALRDMNQTAYEKEFFLTYARKFDMANKSVPVLIRQAWIQWHSFPKKNLPSNASLNVDDMYRVDFVAFWNNKRFLIFVDDISHYALKQGKNWLANEESYSKRLQEDRKLRKEGWQVFRISNWELKNKDSLEDMLIDLQYFIGFE
jgi:hypothetical protein